MSFSSKIYILNPEKSDQVKNLVTEPGQKEYMTQKGEEGEMNLKIFVDEDDVEENKFGTKVKLHIDEADKIYNRDQGNVSIKKTKEVDVQIFDKTKGMLDNIAIFCPKEDERLFQTAITEYMESVGEEIFDPISMDLNKHREQLEKVFGNFVEANVKSMENDLVSNANIQGNRLQKGSDYNRFTDDYNGELSTIYVDFQGLYLMINSEGRIHTPSNTKGGFERKAKVVKEIVTQLKGIEDMQIGSYQTQLDSSIN